MFRSVVAPDAVYNNRLWGRAGCRHRCALSSSEHRPLAHTLSANHHAVDLPNLLQYYTVRSYFLVPCVFGLCHVSYALMKQFVCLISDLALNWQVDADGQGEIVLADFTRFDLPVPRSQFPRARVRVVPDLTKPPELGFQPGKLKAAVTRGSPGPKTKGTLIGARLMSGESADLDRGDRLPTRRNLRPVPA